MHITLKNTKYLILLNDVRWNSGHINLHSIDPNADYVWLDVSQWPLIIRYGYNRALQNNKLFFKRFFLQSFIQNGFYVYIEFSVLSYRSKAVLIW